MSFSTLGADLPALPFIPQDMPNLPSLGGLTNLTDPNSAQNPLNFINTTSSSLTGNTQSFPSADPNTTTIQNAAQSWLGQQIQKILGVNRDSSGNITSFFVNNVTIVVVGLIFLAFGLWLLGRDRPLKIERA